MGALEKYYEIDEIMRNNLLGVLEELIINGDDPKTLFAWRHGEDFIIQQCIRELRDAYSFVYPEIAS